MPPFLLLGLGLSALSLASVVAADVTAQCAELENASSSSELTGE